MKPSPLTSTFVATTIAAVMLAVAGCGGSSSSVVTVTADPATSGPASADPPSSPSAATETPSPATSSRLLTNAQGICDELLVLDLGGVAVGSAQSPGPTTYLDVYMANNVVQQYLTAMISDPDFGAQPLGAEVADLGYRFAEYVNWLGDNASRYGEYEEYQDAKVTAVEAAIVESDARPAPIAGPDLQRQATITCATLPS